MSKKGLNSNTIIENAFKAYYQELCLFAISFVGELEIAEDLIQDIFVKLFAQNKDLTSIQNHRAYLYNATRNACLNYLDRHKRNQQKTAIYLKQMSQTESIEAAMLRADRKIEICKAIDALPEQCRKTFLLCNVNELKYKEAAEELNISVNSVKTQMKKAYRILRSALKEIYTIFL